MPNAFSNRQIRKVVGTLDISKQEKAELRSALRQYGKEIALEGAMGAQSNAEANAAKNKLNETIRAMDGKHADKRSYSRISGSIFSYSTCVELRNAAHQNYQNYNRMPSEAPGAKNASLGIAVAAGSLTGILSALIMFSTVASPLKVANGLAYASGVIGVLTGFIVYGVKGVVHRIADTALKIAKNKAHELYRALHIL